MFNSIIRPIISQILRPIVGRSPIDTKSSFSPLALFAAGEQGAWYDPSDLSTLFQDSTGATPVTAAGQPVGLIRDKSGRGNHASQVTDSSKPILRNTGNLWYLEFDGVDDFLATGTMDFTATDKMSVFAGVRKLSDVATGVVCELSASSVVNGSFTVTAPGNSGLANFGFGTRGTVRGVSMSRITYVSPISAVLSMLSNHSGSGSEGSAQLKGRVNGSELALSGTSPGNHANLPLYIGRRAGTSLPFTGYLYGLIVRGAATDTAGITSSEKYIATKSGVTL